MHLYVLDDEYSDKTGNTKFITSRDLIQEEFSNIFPLYKF